MQRFNYETTFLLTIKYYKKMKRIFRTVAFALALGAMSASFVACEDDENGVEAPGIEEQINFSGITAVAKADGKIEIQGNVTANAKITTLQIVDENGKEIVDLLKSGDQTKVKELNEAGEKEKTFTLAIPTTPVDVQIMKIVGKTRGEKKAESAVIGEKLEVTVGSATSATGSYLSLIDNKIYKYADAQANPAAIDVIAASSGEKGDKVREVIGIQRASKAQDASISAKAGKTALFDGTGAKIDTDASVLSGTIITESGCIAKFKVEPNSADQTAAMTGVIIKNSTTLPLDVTAFTFSK